MMTSATEVHETARRAAQIERELQRLIKAYRELERPSLVERAGRGDYRDSKVRQRRDDREHARRDVEARAAMLIAEHEDLCAVDASLRPLDPPDSLQLTELRRRLSPLKMAAGRYRVLLSLPAPSRMTVDLRRAKLVELEQEISRLSRIIRRIEAARQAQPEHAGR